MGEQQLVQHGNSAPPQPAHGVPGMFPEGTLKIHVRDLQGTFRGLLGNQHKH